MTDTLATNRTLLEIRWRQSFCDLRSRCLPEAANINAKEASENKGYYLMDPPNGSGLTKPLRVQALSKVSSRILEQELAEAGIPRSEWPETQSFDVFNEYLDVNYLALIADFGTKPLRNTTV